MLSLSRVAASLALSLTALSATAQERVLDSTAVRHRLYSPAGHVEASVSVGLPLNTYLTAHYLLDASVAYNVVDTFAVEGRAGYALSRHTGLARSISESFLARQDKKVTDELRDMWEMNLHGVVGLRWAPIYGKLSLVGDTAVHFQAWLWGGAGVASLRRESVIQCTQVVDRSLGVCDDRTNLEDPSTASKSYWVTESRLAPVGSAAFGLRFFLAGNQALRLELRDWVFRDSYRVNLAREDWEAGRATGESAPNPGITHLVQFELGYSFLF